MDDHYSQPAVNVKSRAGLPPDVYHVLTEEEIQGLWQDAVDHFWEDAQEIAADYGYGAAYSNGRMGGWLTVQHPGSWFEYVGDTEHNGRHPLSAFRGLEPEWDAGTLDPDDREDVRTARRQRSKWRKFARAIQDLQHGWEGAFEQEALKLKDERERAARNNALALAAWRY